MFSGPAAPFSLLKPTHCVAPSGALASLSYNPDGNAADKAGYGNNAGFGGGGAYTDPNSPMSSGPYTGLFSDNGGSANGSNNDNDNGNGNGNNNGGPEEQQEIIIWDRLPKHDHFDMEMPSKVTLEMICYSIFALYRMFAWKRLL